MLLLASSSCSRKPIDFADILGHPSEDVRHLLGQDPAPAPLQAGDIVSVERYKNIAIANGVIVDELFVNYDKDGIAKVLDADGFPADIALKDLRGKIITSCKVTMDALGTGTEKRELFRVSIEGPCTP